MNKKSILFVVNVDWFFISHRLIIAEEALKKGYNVIVAGEDTGRASEITNKGIRFVNLPISRSGINPLKEYKTIISFYKLYLDVKPDIVHHITLKPVIYGSIISKLLKVKMVVNAVSGLGFTFTQSAKGVISSIMLFLMKFGFDSEKVVVIFQNIDDYNELHENHVLNSKNKVFFVKGAGVDLAQYHKMEMPKFDKIKVLMPSRLLWDKGVMELYEASVILKSKYSNKVEFVLAGMADVDNKAGVNSSFLEKWQDGQYVTWVGYKTNVLDLYKNSHIVVLPSYREGMPKTLIEACAVGRAIVTTDAIGCRDCVDNNINGLKVPIKDSISLAKALEKLINNPSLIVEMGEASRIKAIKEFDVNLVLNIHMEIYSKCI